MRRQTHTHTDTHTDTQTERGYNHENGVIKEHNPDVPQSSVTSFECMQPVITDIVIQNICIPCVINSSLNVSYRNGTFS